MRKLELAYDRERFWRDYWRDHGIDHSRFEDLGMYPIVQTLRHVRPGQRILECGCGAGRVVRHLAGEGYDVTGLEYDVAIIDALRAAAPELSLVQGDVTGLPFEDASFDVVLCFGVVGTLEGGLPVAVSEISRVTKPGGTILVSVMLDNLARRAQKVLNAATAKQPPQFYAWMDSEIGWRDFFESRDLTVVETTAMVSRYNVFYWTPILRGRGPTDLTAARVDDRKYRLNAAGSLLWLLHKHLLRQSLAAAMVFALRKSA